VITPRAALLIFSPFLLRLKLFDVTARDVIRIIQQKISDAEQAGVREVPLLNLRRLIDQIEQDILVIMQRLPTELKAAVVGQNSTPAS
jgi:hypothetical protein